jgi:hypothetical protein
MAESSFAWRFYHLVACPCRRCGLVADFTSRPIFHATFRATYNGRLTRGGDSVRVDDATARPPKAARHSRPTWCARGGLMNTDQY